MPLELPFAYRPNRLFVEGMKSGALTVLLTLLYLSEGCGELAWQAGIMAQKDGNRTDIDLMVMCDGGIIVVECKDNFKTGAEEVAAVRDQLTRDLEVAQKIGAGRVIFATLVAGVLPDTLEDFLATSAVQKLQPVDLFNSL